MQFKNKNVPLVMESEKKLLTTPDKLITTGCPDRLDELGLEYLTWLLANDQTDYFYKLPIWYKKVRPEILERDKHECQLCKYYGTLTVVQKRGYVHHIAELKHFPLLALNYNNLVTLCYHCHELTHDRVFNINNIQTIDDFENFDSTETW